MSSRLERLAESLELPLLVSGSANLTYLTGFESSNAALLVDPGGHAILYTDFRYAEAARGIAGTDLVETRRDLLGTVAEHLSGRDVAIESAHLSYALGEQLRAGGVRIVPAVGLVECLRAVKEPAELDAIARACALSDSVYADLAEERFTARTERDLAWFVERRFRERGAESLAFESIVASGERGARPHARPAAVPIPANATVTVDMGCRVDGYCSDCTRTFATGSLPDALAQAYALCAAAQLDGLAAVSAGVMGRDADAASRVRIEAAGLGSAYGHGLGHGLGMEVHEAPVLRPDSVDTLAAGNVVSVEPGLYLPGVGGVRIEDLVVVREDGCDVLTHFAKELVTVG